MRLPVLLERCLHPRFQLSPLSQSYSITTPPLPPPSMDPPSAANAPANAAAPQPNSNPVSNANNNTNIPSNNNNSQQQQSPFPNNPPSNINPSAANPRAIHQHIRDDSHHLDHHHHQSPLHHHQHHHPHHDPHNTHPQQQQQYRSDDAAAAIRHRIQQQSNARQHASPTPRQQVPPQQPPHAPFQPSPTGNPSASTDHDVHALHHGMAATQHLLPTTNASLVGNVGGVNVGNLGSMATTMGPVVSGSGPSTLIAPVSQSSPTLWNYFKRGDKMQKTNKFEANCIFCFERQGILTKVRGEKRMMSGHLRNCANAPDSAKSEGEAVAIDLKNRRHFNRSRSNSNNNTTSSSAANLGINPTSMRKKSKSRLPAHTAAAASAAAGSMMAAMAAANVNVVVAANTNNNSANHNLNHNHTHNTTSHQNTGQGGGGDNSASYFKNVHPAFMTNDGIRIFYEERGSGHPLILIHGWSGTSKYFVRNFTTLADHFRVIQFDLRGHGESQKVSWGFHVHRLAADLNDLMEHLGLNNVAVLGCSLGCAVIWAYVELFGVQKISAAMFVDQSPWQMVAPDGSWQYGSSGAFSESAIACLSAKLQENPKDFHMKNVQMCLNRDPTMHERDFFVNEALKSEAWFLSKLMADHSNIDWRSVLQLVTCPALVIVGKRSKIFPWQGVAYAADKMPNATLITFDEGSHWLYYEEADKFNAVVKTWLQKLHPQS